MPHQPASVPMSFIETVIWFLVGMLISVVFPVAIKTLKSLRKKVRLEAQQSETAPSFVQRVFSAWRAYGGNKYLWLLVLATVIAVVLVFMLGLQFYNPRDAALAGIGWESLTNKIFSGQQSEL